MPLDLPPRRERIFNIPPVVIAVCVVLLAIHGIGTMLTAETYGRWLIRFAFVPGRFTFAFDPDRVSAAFNVIARTDELRAQIAAHFLGDGTPQWWTIFTYAFLHGSWTHVGLNCLWLVAFGGAVAKRFHAIRFLLLLIVSAIFGAFAHYLAHAADLEPVIGASAAVSGAMGAATRFVFQADSPFRLGVSDDRDDMLRRPALTLLQTITSKRSLTFILIWFFTNVIFGVTGAMPGNESATIAWEAHIGGFLAGLILFAAFDPPSKSALRETTAEGSIEALGPDEKSRLDP